MTNEQEQKLKQMAEQENMLAMAGTMPHPPDVGSLNQCGQALKTLSHPKATLRDRIEAQAYHAERESYRAGRLRELSELLAKHPDVARILDLLEEVRG